MDMSQGTSAKSVQAAALMLQALLLLDEAHMGLPAVHLQSALDSLRCESPECLPDSFDKQALSLP